MAILAIQYPTFQRAMRIISGITNANPVEITTTFNHQYQTGDIIRLIIPPGFGITAIDQYKGEIIVTGDTTFTMDLDTSLLDVFTTPASYPESYQYAQCVPVGETNSILTSATQNVLPITS